MQINLFTILDAEKTFNAVCDSIGCENNVPAWPDYFGKAVSVWLQNNSYKPIRTLSLFSGAGGLDIGFSDIGFEIVDSVEIERKFCETLELNTGDGKRFPHSKVNCIDIREFSGDTVGNVDFIIGGPPCQTFSAAGRRANGVLGTTDARGVLFREYVRLLRKLSPKGFLFENVYGIVGAQGGEAWSEIQREFSDVGYKLFYRIVDAADYGAPQHRERLIIVGLKEGTFEFPRPTHGPDSVDNAPFYNAETAIEGVCSSESPESNKLGGRYASLLDAIPPGLNYSFYTEEMGHPNPIFAWRSKFSDFLYKADPNTPVRTIKASGGAYTGPLHWENRFFTLEEYKRLQTFPDDYQISGNKQTAVKQIGNSVPPQLARMMAIAIREQVFGTNFPFALSYLTATEQLSFRKNKRELTEIYRKKAEMAIKAMQNTEGALPESRTYYCTLSERFKFTQGERCNSEYTVSVNWGNDLTISVNDTNDSSEDSIISLEITAKDKPWSLGVQTVRLIVCSSQPLGYTVAWKAFERELIDNAIKADLVQLNGYYQSVPRIQCRCIFSGDMPYSDAIKRVVSHDGVGIILSGNELAQTWSVSESDVMRVAAYLRKLGYEVRNHSTNPQIDEGDWLIPYMFPTLTPMSVQLWKKLM